MKETLVTWIKAGYPHLKEQSGVPLWILPEHRFARVADEFGDNGVLAITGPLGVNNRIESLLEKAPELETSSVDVWQEAIRAWPPLIHVKDMVEACLETTGGIMRLFNSGRLYADPIMVCRGVVALSFAPFLLEGMPLLKDIAPVLNSDANRPADLLRQYGRTLALGDIMTAKEVDECIGRHSQWSEVATASVKQAINCPYTPKPIGVTPPMSPEMVTVLADMLKEDAR
jgi:hypothetical protein